MNVDRASEGRKARDGKVMCASKSPPITLYAIWNLIFRALSDIFLCVNQSWNFILFFRLSVERAKAMGEGESQLENFLKNILFLGETWNHVKSHSLCALETVLVPCAVVRVEFVKLFCEFVKNVFMKHRGVRESLSLLLFINKLWGG